MQLILLAAGQGSRLPKILRSKPKCMVEVNQNKKILDYNLKFYRYFEKKIIITGYKSYLLKFFIKQQKFKEVKNKMYNKTNMVFSAFQCHKLIKDDVVICYTDIIFDHTLYSKLKEKKNLLPLKKNWLKVWRGRMNMQKIKIDAEDVKVKNGHLISIGEKINKKLPKYQYMGIIKLKLNDYHKLRKYFKKLKMQKINFTKFIDMAVKDKIIEINVVKTNKYWLEIDNSSDLKFAKRKLW